MRPPPWFVARQHALQQCMDASAPNGAAASYWWELLEAMRKPLERDFMSAFKLLPDFRRRAANIRYNCYGCHDLLDHTSQYTTGEDRTPVIVTQPYRTEDATVLEAKKSFPDAIVTGLSPWAFYYPGQACLVMIQFPAGFKI